MGAMGWPREQRNRFKGRSGHSGRHSRLGTRRGLQEKPDMAIDGEACGHISYPGSGEGMMGRRHTADQRACVRARACG
eukprot:2700307-Alexandrium_andersonii.AAC.1